MRVTGFIFAAGLGTRLYPLTASKPKALVRFEGKTLLDNVLDKMFEAGVPEVIVNVHHFPDMIVEALRRHPQAERIRVSDERAYLRDTAGGLKFAEPLWQDSDLLLIHNVDIVSDININMISTSEIRVTVPKETAAPGFPVLTLADGTNIIGKTELTYSEPILIESVTPAEAVPGTEITIKGDYLNLIHEVIFTSKVNVSESAFTAHDRYTIKVVVPEEARTGKIGLGTVDEAAAEDETLLASLNIVETEEEFVVLTAQGTLAATTVKAGETVTINGTNLNLVKSIVLEGATVTDFTATASKLTFALPASASDGEVLMVMASGVEVSAGALETVVPSGLSVSPAPVKNGAELTVTGTDIDLVTGVELPNAGWVEFTSESAIVFRLLESTPTSSSPATSISSSNSPLA